MVWVETHESEHAAGEVLLQSEGEAKYPSLFYSQALNTAQHYYSTNEPELLADYKAGDAFRVYVLGREFSLRTEHAAFSAIFNCPFSSTRRVAKWLKALQPFRFAVTHIKGEENVAEDRLPNPVSSVYG